MIRDYQAIMKTWLPVGKQRIIPTYGKHEGVKLVGFLDYETGSVYVPPESPNLNKIEELCMGLA